MFKTQNMHNSSILHTVKKRFLFDQSRGVQYLSQKTYDSVVEILESISTYIDNEPEKSGWDYWVELLKRKQNNISSYMKKRYSESFSGALRFSAPTSTLIESNREVDFFDADLLEEYSCTVLPEALDSEAAEVVQRVFEELKGKVQGCSISEQSLIVDNYGFASIFGN